MTIVAEKCNYFIGIDTHSRTHTSAIVDTTTGARVGCEAFPVTKPGMNRAIAWICRNTTGDILASIEGTNSYGSSIRRALIVDGIRVVEVKPPKKKTRHGVGKSDPIEAFAAATSILGQETEVLLHPRGDGERAANSVLLAARRRVDHQRTAPPTRCRPRRWWSRPYCPSPRTLMRAPCPVRREAVNPSHPGRSQWLVPKSGRHGTSTSMEGHFACCARSPLRHGRIRPPNSDVSFTTFHGVFADRHVSEFIGDKLYRSWMLPGS